MKIRNLIKVFGMLITTSTIITAQSDVTVAVDGIEKQEGKIIFAVFDDKDGFPKDMNKAMYKQEVNVEGESASAVFKDLPYGPYAFIVIHDKDSNGKLNTNFIGMPKEKVGCSNQVKKGKPNFEKSIIEVNEERKVVQLKFIN